MKDEASLLELYDLNEDPCGLTSRVEEAAHQDTFERLLGLLQSWAVQTDDKYTVLKSLPAEPAELLPQLKAAGNRK